MQTTLIDLIRHGEPVGGKRYRGQLDDPLSEKGWQQMREAVNGNTSWQQIVTSPLLRCVEFAQELEQKHAIPLKVDARLKEIGFGCWEGQTASELLANDPEKIIRFQRDPLANRPAGAEPLQHFHDRVTDAWNDLLQEYAGQHVLLVVHAGVMRVIVGHILGMPLEAIFRIQVANAGITRIQVRHDHNGDFPQLLFHGGKL